MANYEWFLAMQDQTYTRVQNTYAKMVEELVDEGGCKETHCVPVGVLRILLIPYL